ncbi:MAG: hypothetical protein ABUS54_00570 [Actinomycetota bacterium]
MGVIRLPSWREVLDGPWALRLRSGATGAWLMRGEAEQVPELECVFAAGSAARNRADAIDELRAAFQIEDEVDSWEGLARAVPAGPVALLVLDTDRLLADEPEQLAQLVGALRSAADRSNLHVVFQARELPLEAEAVLAEFGVAEILA